MKNLSILGALVALCSVTAAFGCKVTFINDTNTAVFAFDENYNEGNIIEPGNQHAYGERGRHPVVTFYCCQTPEGGTFKKSYRIMQIACALNEMDKMVSLSKAVDGDLNKGIYTITDFALNPEVPPCCMHEGGDHEKMVDEPLTAMDEE